MHCVRWILLAWDFLFAMYLGLQVHNFGTMGLMDPLIFTTSLCRSFTFTL